MIVYRTTRSNINPESALVLRFDLSIDLLRKRHVTSFTKTKVKS